MISSQELHELGARHPLIPEQELFYLRQLLLATGHHQAEDFLQQLLELRAGSPDALTLYLSINEFFWREQATLAHDSDRTSEFDRRKQERVLAKIKAEDFDETPQSTQNTGDVFHAREWQRLFGLRGDIPAEKLQNLSLGYKKAISLLYDYEKTLTSDADYLISVSDLPNWRVADVLARLQAKVDGPNTLENLCHLLCLVACQTSDKKNRKNAMHMDYLKLAEWAINNPTTSGSLAQVVENYFRGKM